MAREVAAVGADRGTDEMGLSFVKLHFVNPEDQEGDADERPSKGRVVGFYRAFQRVTPCSCLLRPRTLHTDLLV